jgi:uncharacterized protein with NAD-binding domain and iron-sulfur cluster
MAATVLVLGGGIGGLSAAHELVERGYSVRVIEKRAIPGGKARSLLVPDSAVPPRAPLPGEHGFRFFPQFYRHIIDTMARTPRAGGGTSADQLVFASREMMALAGLPPMIFPAHAPTSATAFIVDLVSMLKASKELAQAGLVESDYIFFGEQVWKLMTACPERALVEFENESWWDFMQADSHSLAFQHIFVEGLTRSLVAAKAEVANVRAGGVVLTQLMYGSFAAAPSFDRLLNGPTSPVWISDWHAYLAGRGVQFQFETAVSGILCDSQRITGVQTTGADGTQQVQTADWYVCALPVEYAGPLITPAMVAVDPGLAGVQALATKVYDMTGIQFYLDDHDVPLVNGHILLVDAPWALTGISQRQFWPGIDFSQLGDGSTQGILSIDISDWDTPGVCVVNPNAPPQPNGNPTYKTARQCTPDEVALEVWTQLRGSLTAADGSCPLAPQHPRFFIDPGMVFAPTPVSNDSRLFVNEVGTWTLRPQAATKIPNFFIASDYVQTNTNLATMEAANEAARRAVNALLSASGSTAAPCTVWDLPVPVELEPFIEFDKLLWDGGKAWTGQAAPAKT